MALNARVKTQIIASFANLLKLLGIIRKKCGEILYPE